MDAIETIQFPHGVVAKIYLDVDNDLNPIQDYDGEAHVSIFHPDYDFGNHQEFATPQDFLDFCKTHEVIWVPVYLLDHSGLSVRTGNFDDCDPGSWDSGQVGYCWITLEEATRDWGTQDKAVIEKNLEGTVKLLDHFLTGSVYGYVIEDAKHTVLDSTWGFFGTFQESGILDEARATAKQHVEEAAQRKVEYEARRAKCFAI